MPKRVQIALATLLVSLVIVTVWQMLPPREPVYQGKRLSGWLNQYMANHWEVAGRNSELDEQAQSAIQQIGTNAIPALLRMLRAKDSALKVKIMDLGARQRIIKIRYVTARNCNWAATAGFEVLGAEAQSAVPALMEIVNLNISPTSQAAAIRALGSIGPPAKEVVPSLLQWTTNANNDVRYSSICSLAQISTEPELVVPVLMRALREWDPEVQTKAVSALGNFGLDAKPAVPALLELLNRRDPFAVKVDRTLVTNVIKKIDPEAAAGAGIN